MIGTIHFPYELTGPELDYYLSIGWYRMGQTIFTTHFIPVNDKIHRVYWLRVLVQQVQYGKRQKRLFAINKHFSITVKPFYPSDELEELYASYRGAVHFDAPLTVNGFLLSEYDEEFKNIYDTHVIELRDAGHLIAAGIFDNGESSLAGIMNFYHPGYASYSLGKYLMLLKINLAIESGKTYYYPGYVVSGYSKFDYKLFPIKKTRSGMTRCVTNGYHLPLHHFLICPVLILMNKNPLTGMIAITVNKLKKTASLLFSIGGANF